MKSTSASDPTTLPRRAFLAGAAALAAPRAFAQAYPNKPVRLIVPFAAGSSSDVVARLVGPLLGEQLGQQVIVDNRPGAGTHIGTIAAVRSPADGYTLLFGVASNVINSLLQTKPEYDFARDLTAIARLISVANVVTVPMDFPAKTMKEFIDYTKANPGKVNMASNGNGSSTHIAGELFNTMTGAKLVHVPYSGNYYPDLINNVVQTAFSPISGVIGFVQAGQMRALAVTTDKRSEFLPEVPAMAEFLPGYQAAGWYGLVAPKGTPADVIERVNRAANAMMADARMKERLPALGGAIFTASAAEFERFITAENDKWAGVIKAANIRVE